APTTTHGQIHNAAGITTFVAMLVVMAASSWRFRREPHWHGFALPTAVLTTTGVAAFFLVPILGQAHFGISQRLLIGSFLIWMLAAAGHQLRSTAPEATTAALLPEPVGPGQ
ncbi:MAG TPA: DUF998 domain-containing protein, partial [Marmoricola sp.]|nr:DUF998 domain-containing protein [Marmoricola sp.]